MSKKSQQDMMDIYLLHRECVRRNPAYAEAYHQIHAIRDADEQAVELVELANRWGLSISDHLPDPSERPGYDPKPLMTDRPISPSTLQDGPMQVDPIEMDAVFSVQEYLSNAVSTLSHELKGFMVLLHLPEKAEQRWEFDVIDLRRPKQEIMAGIQQLIDDARKQHMPTSDKKRRPSVGGSSTKWFQYLKVYDLRKEGLIYKQIVSVMWGTNAVTQDDKTTKARKYFKRANAIIENPPLLTMATEQLAQRRQKRAHSQIQGFPSRPLLWGKRAWLRPALHFLRRSA